MKITYPSAVEVVDVNAVEVEAVAVAAPVAPPFDSAALATLTAEQATMNQHLAETLAEISALESATTKPLIGDTEAMMVQLGEMDAAITRRNRLNEDATAIKAKLALLAPVVAEMERQREQDQERQRQRQGAEQLATAGECYRKAFDALLDALEGYGKAAIAANQQSTFIALSRRAVFPPLPCVDKAVLRPGYFIGRTGGIQVNPNHAAFQ